MALNNLWGKLGAFSRNVLVPSNVIYKSFDADPLVSDKMSRAISRWYGMYVDKPEWADDEVKPLGLPRAIAKEFAQVVSSEMTITADGGPRADFINEQLTRFQSNVQNSIELCMALGGMAFKPYVSGGNVFIDSTSAASFIPLRFDDGDSCVSGVFKSQPVKVDKSYFVKLEYHDFASGVYTIRNKAFTSDENGITGSEVELGRVPEWAAIPEEVQIKNVEKPLFGYFTPPVSNNIDTASSLGVSIYGGATEDLIRDADEQWARFLYEFESAERKIIGTPEAISGSLPGSKANPLLGDRLFIQMPYDSDDFFKEFSPALRHAGYDEVTMANSIFPINQHEAQLRRDHLIAANAKLQALDRQLGLLAGVLWKNPENFKGFDNAFTVWGELIIEEAKLISGIRRSDRARYKNLPE